VFLTRLSLPSCGKGLCSMSDKFDLVRGWLVKAHSDLITGNLVADGDGPYDLWSDWRMR
jgi:hypothetical protein